MTETKLSDQPPQVIKDLGIIIAAGGNSTRFGENKLFRPLAGIPVFMHSVIKLAGLCSPENFILVVPENDMSTFAKDLELYSPSVKPRLVAGGKIRMESVVNGLNILTESASFVAITDAARPFVSAELTTRCVDACRTNSGGALAAHKLTDTVKEENSDGLICRTVDRSRLWAVQTPQVFPVKKLRAAYQQAFEADKSFTDDAGVMEFAGYRITPVDNHDFNIKITYPDDIKLAEAYCGEPTQTESLRGRDSRHSLRWPRAGQPPLT
jgi:2-C-methyl-D-erythritol 4-phosphate cytidylyltransferase